MLENIVKDFKKKHCNIFTRKFRCPFLGYILEDLMRKREERFAYLLYELDREIYIHIESDGERRLLVRETNLHRALYKFCQLTKELYIPDDLPVEIFEKISHCENPVPEIMDLLSLFEDKYFEELGEGSTTGATIGGGLEAHPPPLVVWRTDSHKIFLTVH
jgi:hypothetical protein